MTKGAFVSWVRSCGRSQGFIDALGLTPIYSSYLRQSDVVSAPLKYGPQFIETLRRLRTTQRPCLVLLLTAQPTVASENTRPPQRTCH